MKKTVISKQELTNDIDFTYLDNKIKSRLKNYEPVILLPGLLIGLHSSFINFVEHVASNWGVKSIRIICHSWDYKINTPWVDKLKEVCKDHPIIKLDIVTEKYDNAKFRLFLNELKVNLGGDVNGFVDSQFLKRFVVYYSMMRAYETFLSGSPSNTYVIKLRPCYAFNSDYQPDIFEHIWKAKTVVGPDTLREKYLFTDDLDIVFSSVDAPDRLSESIFFTSLSSFRNILGSSVEELTKKLTSVMLGLENRLGNEEDIAKLDFETKMNTFSVFPYSGAIIFRKLVSQYSNLLMTSQGCIRTIDLNTKWQNPIINIFDYRVLTHTKEDELKTHKYKLFQYIISYKPKTVV
jgi:hypothetical protein